ncbi:serine/threonine-protein kinase [Dactylosporangium maewongense]
MTDDPAAQPTLPPTTPYTPAGSPLGSGYLRDSVIGQGANGRVWRGIRRADSQPVAIKVLREEYAADPEAVARFLRERNALRAVVHPNLVRVLDLVVEGDTLAIVMELVDGLDLRGAAKRGFTTDRAVTVLAQVAAALATVHAAGIVHRDVKPENVLITWRGGEPWARLTDFGIAKVAGGEDLTQQSMVVGTPAYLAPELAMGRPASPAVDVYALGVTAYELLAGHRPFAGDHPMALLRAHLEEEPARPDGLADPVWSVIQACLAKRPADRPEAAALAERFADLQGHTGTLPPDAPPPTPARPAGVAFRDAAPDTGAPPEGEPAPDTGAPPVGEPAPTGPRSRSVVHDDLQPTAGATLPVPDAPAPAPARRRLLAPILGLLTLLVAAAAVGLWTGRPDSTGSPATAGTSSAAGPKSQLYPVPVTATSPQAGVVRLDFRDASTIPGFVSYVIFRDREKIGDAPKDQPSPYLVRGLDPRTEYCYQIWALVMTDVPPPPGPPAPCLAATGGK